MKKILLTLTLTIVFAFASLSSAGSYTTWFPNGDEQVNSTAEAVNGYDHQQLNFNFKDQTATLTIMDPDGLPQHYYYAELNVATYVVYDSVDGIHWYYLGTYYR